MTITSSADMDATEEGHSNLVRTRQVVEADQRVADRVENAR